jgi:hypothetical protein
MIAAPGAVPTRVYTDGFPVYRFYDDRDNFEHFVVVHQNNFGEGLRHTNHIEGTWAVLKSVASFDGGLKPRDVEEVRSIEY